MAKKNPWYPMYASDWLHDTAPWPIEADGLLIRMLNYQQIEGGLPNDWPMIGKLLRVPSRKAKRIFSTYLQPKFDLIDDKWVNRRLAEIMQEQEQKRVKLSNAGIKGNEMRWPKVSGGDTPSDTGGNRILESELESDIKKEKRVVAKATPDHGKAIKFFCDSYESFFSQKYNFKKGKDGANVKRLLETYGLETFKQLVRRLFDSRDKFIRESDRGIGVLSGCSNKLAQNTQVSEEGGSVFDHANA